jgi:hypothetical protein
MLGLRGMKPCMRGDKEGGGGGGERGKQNIDTHTRHIHLLFYLTKNDSLLIRGEKLKANSFTP